MHVLRTLLQEYPVIRRFAAEAAANPVVHGVVLDMNPVWEAGYYAARAGLRWDQMQWWDPAAVVGGLYGDGELDLYWTDDRIRRQTQQWFTGKLDGPLSVMLRVLVRPASRDRDEFSVNLGMGNLRGLLETSPVAAIAEIRPVARFVASAGEACTDGAASSGTLGGFLRDRRTGAAFGATCGHVISAGTAYDAAGGVIGACAHAYVAGPPSPGLCSPHDPLHTLDLSLISVPSAGANRSPAIAPRIRARDLIEMDGRAGPVPYQVGGVSIVQEISGVCFGNLFEVRPRVPTGILSPRASALLATVPVPGDSGSWVHRIAAPEWCGVVVGADHLMGYALEAEDVIREANAEFGTDLELA